MKRSLRKITAVALSAAMLLCVLFAVPLCASAAQQPVLTVKTQSNFFDDIQADYYDLSQIQDENGDIFVTVEFKINAPAKYLINLDLDELTWDPAVLEWKQEYNQIGTGRSKKLNVFPFAAENGFGAGIINQTDENRLVGNFTAVSPAAWAYNDDGSAVTVVKSVFKVLNPNAGETTVGCNIDTLSLCDETIIEPYSQYPLVSGCVVSEQYTSLAAIETVITPASQQPPAALKGDIDGDGEVSVSDATGLQQFLAEFETSIDVSDPDMFAIADVNGDGKLNIRDVTHIQRYLAEVIPEL